MPAHSVETSIQIPDLMGYYLIHRTVYPDMRMDQGKDLNRRTATDRKRAVQRALQRRLEANETKQELTLATVVETCLHPDVFLDGQTSKDLLEYVIQLRESGFVIGSGEVKTFKDGSDGMARRFASGANIFEGLVAKRFGTDYEQEKAPTFWQGLWKKFKL